VKPIPNESLGYHEAALQEPAPKPAAEIASSPEALPLIQGQLAAWCKEKLKEALEEDHQLWTAHDEAKAHKWKCSTLLAAAKKASMRVTFYQKTMAALDAGYMLFPPIDNFSVLAIRTDETQHRFGSVTTAMYNQTPLADVEAPGLDTGEGEWKNPRVRWYRCGTVKAPDGSERQQWGKYLDMESPEFPLVMARAECVEATSRAMEQKVFDEIVLYPEAARKDPVILGRIHDRARDRWLNFLISWRVDKRDL